MLELGHVDLGKWWLSQPETAPSPQVISLFKEVADKMYEDVVKNIRVEVQSGDVYATKEMICPDCEVLWTEPCSCDRLHVGVFVSFSKFKEDFGRGILKPPAKIANNKFMGHHELWFRVWHDWLHYEMNKGFCWKAELDIHHRTLALLPKELHQLITDWVILPVAATYGQDGVFFPGGQRVVLQTPPALYL